MDIKSKSVSLNFLNEELGNKLKIENWNSENFKFLSGKNKVMIKNGLLR